MPLFPFSFHDRCDENGTRLSELILIPPPPPRHSFIDGYFAIRTTLETNYERSQIAFYYCAKRDDEAGEGDKIGAVII